MSYSPYAEKVTEQLSAAERYSRSRLRSRSPQLDDFRQLLDFDLDRFQNTACEALEQGRSVLVAAPTGAGKTVVAEFAVHLAMTHQDQKVFYTTPIKALSNQKYSELCERYGPDQLGLLTGDTNINPSARIVVMTTEVLRNMLYADSPLLPGLAFVVMDEVHYLADRFRGAVWEEVIIHLAPQVRLVSLSATVSNAEEFGDWLRTVRGDTEVVVSEERPVPLEQHMLVRGKLLDLFEESPDRVSAGISKGISSRAQPGDAPAGAAELRLNPELRQLANVPSGAARRGLGFESAPGRAHRPRGGYHGRNSRNGRGGGTGHETLGPSASFRTDRPELAQLLERKNLLPAIFFVFSRVGCEQAVRQLVRARLHLVEEWEREEIRRYVEQRTSTLPGEDFAVLGFWDFLEALECGVAAHHAGMLPAFKEIVEELFRRKLLKIVVATETLALGVNMPARTVVLEKLEKFNGEARVPITAGEYTQLTGRAGRRGIDVEGHSVIQWAPGMDPEAAAALASRRSYPLNSSFRPSYNMAVNLIAQFGRARTRAVLESSFAQFQADRSVVALARKVQGQQESLAGYAEAMRCHLGDFAEYAALRRELTGLERGMSKASQLSASERSRRQDELSELRTRLRRHPCHGCAEREQHARWAERWWRLEQQTAALSTQIRSRTGAVARVFDRVTEVLLQLGYLIAQGGGEVDGGLSAAGFAAAGLAGVGAADEPGGAAELELTAYGQSLRRIYGERDLLVAECLRHGLWRGLDAPSLAALACTLVYEARREDAALGEAGLPRGAFRAALERTQWHWAELDELERSCRLPGSSPLSPALAPAMHMWARGGSLGAVLEVAGLPAGDFVRWAKQTIDLLDQLSLVADAPLAATARTALGAVRRGIVAYSSLA